MIGRRLGIWVIDRELGQGGMGSVWRGRAEPAVPGQPELVAIKILAPELAREEGLRLRFQREISILQKLEHPNIVALFRAGEEGGIDYYAMEFIDGPSYQHIIERDRRLPWTEVVELGQQIALALKHAHDRGVIHRDLKPSNLLQAPKFKEGEESQIKLADFGISSLFASRHLTAPGGILGTAEYLSPEQAVGKPATAPKRSLFARCGSLHTAHRSHAIHW